MRPRNAVVGPTVTVTSPLLESSLTPLRSLTASHRANLNRPSHIFRLCLFSFPLFPGFFLGFPSYWWQSHGKYQLLSIFDPGMCYCSFYMFLGGSIFISCGVLCGAFVEWFDRPRVFPVSLTQKKKKKES